MFIEIEPSKINNQFAFYTLTDAAGICCHAGVVPFTQLCALTDLPDPAGIAGKFYMSIISTDEDRLKLMNRAIGWCDDQKNPALRDRLLNAYKISILNKRERAVICNETGERFKSATACSVAHGLTYGALLNHLKKRQSHNTVKGRTYRYE
jgi:hypothetical protein